MRRLPQHVGKRHLQFVQPGMAMFSIDDDIDLHFAGADHIDVDPGVGKCAKHADRDARMAPQADAGNRQFGDLWAMRDVMQSSCWRDLGHVQGLLQLVGGYGEADADLVPVPFVALDDHIDKNAGIGHALKHLSRDARPVRHADDRDQRLGFVQQISLRTSSSMSASCRRSTTLTASGPLVTGCAGGFVGNTRFDFSGVLFQGKRLVHGAQCLLCHVAIDERRDLDFAGRDHLDIDVLGGQRGEHAIGDARLLGHAQSDDGDFGDIVVVIDFAGSHDFEPLRRLPAKPFPIRCWAR